MCGSRATVPVFSRQKSNAATAPAHSPAAIAVPSASGSASTRATPYPAASYPVVMCGHLPTGGSAYIRRPAATPAPAPMASATGLKGGRRAVTARSPAT